MQLRARHLFLGSLALALGYGIASFCLTAPYALGKPAVLRGTLARGNAVDIQLGKEVPVTFPSLILEKSITVQEDKAEEGMKSIQGLSSVDVIHLSISPAFLWTKFDLLVGKKVRVECTELFSAFTAHHFAPVLCTVREIHVM